MKLNIEAWQLPVPDKSSWTSHQGILCHLNPCNLEIGITYIFDASKTPGS